MEKLWSWWIMALLANYFAFSRCYYQHLIQLSQIASMMQAIKCFQMMPHLSWIDLFDYSRYSLQLASVIAKSIAYRSWALNFALAVLFRDRANSSWRECSGLDFACAPNPATPWSSLPGLMLDCLSWESRKRESAAPFFSYGGGCSHEWSLPQISIDWL